MRILLDTHVWLWSAGQPNRLSPDARAVLEDPENELWLSAVSVWEAQVVLGRGRIRLNAPVGEWIDHQLRVFPLRDAPVTRQIALAARDIDLGHSDPFDRLIAATAAVDGLQLLTADAALLQSRAYKSIRAG